jgi:hypothetical protein
MRIKLFIIILFELAFNAAYSQIPFDKAIHNHMQPILGFIGEWNVNVKEVNGNDTLRFHGTATSRIHRDSIRFKRDSASIKFNFTWEAKLTQDILDIKSIDVNYLVDAERYSVIINHEFRDGWRTNAYSPKLDTANQKLYFFNSDTKYSDHPIVLSQWVFNDDKIVLTHRERRPDPKQYRMLILTFPRKKV